MDESHQDVQVWLEKVFETEFESGNDSLFNAIKNGVLLCKLVSILDPSISFRFNKSPKISVACHENIQLFLSYCKNWHINAIFTSIDLYDRRNFSQVVSCIAEVGVLFSNKGFEPAFISTKKIKKQKGESESSVKADFSGGWRAVLQEKEPQRRMHIGTNRISRNPTETSVDTIDTDENNYANREANRLEELYKGILQNEDHSKSNQNQIKTETTKKEKLGFGEFQIDADLDAVPREKYFYLLEQYRHLQRQYVLQSEELSEAKITLNQSSHSSKLKRKEMSFVYNSIRASAEKISSKGKKIAKEEEEEEEKFAEEQKIRRKRIMEMKEQKRKEKEDLRRANLTDKNQLQRMSVLQEILNTERGYLTNLQTLIRAKYALNQTRSITEQENFSIFSNVEELYAIHQNIAKMLDTRFLQTNDNDCWKVSTGDIFLTLSASLTKYTNYVDNQANQNRAVSSCAQRKTFINALCKLPEFEQRDLVVVQFNSFLITPIQRMCKYPLLLRELIKFTDDSHKDKLILQEALNQIQNATKLVNEQKKEFESYVKMLEIHETIDHLPKGFQLITPNRMFIMESTMDKISKGKTQERHFYLFNDLILYGKESVLKSTKIQCKGKIPLDSLLVRDLMDTESQKNAFELVRMDFKKKKYIICAKDPAEKKLWMQNIEERVLHYLDVAREKGKQPEQKHNPEQTENS